MNIDIKPPLTSELHEQLRLIHGRLLLVVSELSSILDGVVILNEHMLWRMSYDFEQLDQEMTKLANEITDY